MMSLVLRSISLVYCHQHIEVLPVPSLVSPMAQRNLSILTSGFSSPPPLSCADASVQAATLPDTVQALSLSALLTAHHR